MRFPGRRGRPETLSAADAYELWDYPEGPDNPVMALDQQGMTAFLPDANGLRVLDLACGNGRYLQLLSPNQPSRLLGLDLAERMVHQAHKRGFPVLRGSLSSLPVASRSFDLVTCGLAIGHLADLEPAIAEVARVLDRGGTFVYSDFHPDATEAGFQRTFPGPGGKTLAVEHHLHSIEAHNRALNTHGFRQIQFEHLGGSAGPKLVLAVRAVKA